MALKKMKWFVAVLVVLVLAGASCVNAKDKEVPRMKITSPEFKNNDMMPPRFGYYKDNVNPKLVIENIPPKAKSLALIVDDPDAPSGTWVHWVVYNIPIITEIKEGATIGTQGMTDFREMKYGGPCPPSGTHRYFFKIYALDVESLGLAEGADKKAVENAMKGHILDKAELVGLYKR